MADPDIFDYEFDADDILWLIDCCFTPTLEVFNPEIQSNFQR